jgi:hypothetical protein
LLPLGHLLRSIAQEANVTEVYFHCSNARQKTRIDGHRIEVCDLVEAHEYAACVIRALIMEPGTEDWRGWVMHVADEMGDEIFTLPFTSMLGKPH